MTQLIAGVDEAGRGPVIGPLVIAGVVISPSQEDTLLEWGVRDSKQLSPGRRETLAHHIRKVATKVEILEISAKQIDTDRQKKSLNVLEADWMAQVLNRLHWDVAYVDASDVNADRYGRMITAQLKNPK
ncbi:MAG: ribonuclease HII, partial [Promethearchaeota archaeon]